MRKPLVIVAVVMGSLVALVLAVIAASYVFNFSIPWVNLGVAWVMVVVPSSLFVIATSAGKKK